MAAEVFSMHLSGMCSHVGMMIYDLLHMYLSKVGRECGQKLWSSFLIHNTRSSLEKESWNQLWFPYVRSPATHRSEVRDSMLLGEGQRLAYLINAWWLARYSEWTAWESGGSACMVRGWQYVIIGIMWTSCLSNIHVPWPHQMVVLRGGTQVSLQFRNHGLSNHWDQESWL